MQVLKFSTKFSTTLVPVPVNTKIGVLSFSSRPSSNLLTGEVTTVQVDTGTFHSKKHPSTGIPCKCDTPQPLIMYN